MNNQWCHTGLIPNKRGATIKGMTGASAQHTAKAKFNKMSDFRMKYQRIMFIYGKDNQINLNSI